MPVEWRIAQKRIEGKSCRTVIKPKAEAILWSFYGTQRADCQCGGYSPLFRGERQAGQSGNDLPESRQDDGRRHFVKI